MITCTDSPFSNFCNTTFSTEEQLAALIGSDNKRLVEIWNSLPGVTPVSKFANRKIATERIWKAIQGLGEAPATPSPVAATEDAVTEEPVPNAATEQVIEAEIERAMPEEFRERVTSQVDAQAPATVASAEPVGGVGAQAADVAPAETDSRKKAAARRRRPKRRRSGNRQSRNQGPGRGAKPPK